MRALFSVYTEHGENSHQKTYGKFTGSFLIDKTNEQIAREFEIAKEIEKALVENRMKSGENQYSIPRQNSTQGSESGKSQLNFVY